MIRCYFRVGKLKQKDIKSLIAICCPAHLQIEIDGIVLNTIKENLKEYLLKTDNRGNKKESFFAL